jgi:hypothetical protein
MMDTYKDCPDRERAQWWGDDVNGVVSILLSLHMKDINFSKGYVF